MFTTTGTERNERGWGHKIPGLLNNRHWHIACIVFVAWLAAKFAGEDYPGFLQFGSLSALIYLAIFAAILLTARTGVHANSNHVRIAKWIAGLSILSIFIEPGPLNLGMGWLSLAVLAAAVNGISLNDIVPLLKTICRQTLACQARILMQIPGLNYLPTLRRVSNKTIVAARLPFFAKMILPAVSTFAFAVLLAIANPVLDRALQHINVFRWLLPSSLWGPVVAGFAVLVFWPLLRIAPSPASPAEEAQAIPAWHRTFFQPISVAVTLFILNTLFAFENLLDMQHVWFSGLLPGNLSHAEYVHRGAYTLIVTAVLAAALMIFMMWPGSATAQSASIRKLVYVWSAQNALLVASSMKRTFSYVDAYGMTEWRLAGLVWMGLVGFGLASICWHIVRQRSNHWLINSNLIASFLLLMVCGFVDGRALVANWNVDRAIADFGRGNDYDYIVSLGPSALPALKRLRSSIPNVSDPPSFAIELPRYLNWKLSVLEDERVARQSGWRSWTLRFALLPS
jgi:hypothetical protein